MHQRDHEKCTTGGRVLTGLCLLVKPSEVCHIPFVNPLNGPIYVEGAESGDTLAVRIDSIRPRGPQPRGVTCLQLYFGGLSPTASALCDPFPELVRKVEVTEEGVCGVAYPRRSSRHSVVLGCRGWTDLAFRPRCRTWRFLFKARGGRVK